LTKFAHVESRFCGRKRCGEATFDVPIKSLGVRASVTLLLSGWEQASHLLTLQRHFL
jgi:hypothetical protein